MLAFGRIKTRTQIIWCFARLINCLCSDAKAIEERGECAIGTRAGALAFNTGDELEVIEHSRIAVL